MLRGFTGGLGLVAATSHLNMKQSTTSRRKKKPVFKCVVCVFRWLSMHTSLQIIFLGSVRDLDPSWTRKSLRVSWGCRLCWVSGVSLSWGQQKVRFSIYMGLNSVLMINPLLLPFLLSYPCVCVSPALSPVLASFFLPKMQLLLALLDIFSWVENAILSNSCLQLPDLVTSSASFPNVLVFV